jgi:hypothetical protein
MHPLFHLIATRPQLLADHAEAYAGLVAAEIPRLSTAFKRKLLLNALALIGLLVGLTLAGVALMLWSLNPSLGLPAGWPLLVVPLVPIGAALACLIAAQARSERAAFGDLRIQAKADIAMLREVQAL